MNKRDHDTLVKSIESIAEIPQLDSIAEAIKSRRDALSQEVRDKTFHKIEELVRESGLSLNEVLPRRTGQSVPQGPMTVRFRDPQNPQNVWGGRGKKPSWLTKALESGRKLEDFKAVEQGASKQAA